MMDNKIIANKIKVLAEEIQANSDYVYDPKHQNRPHGGGQWHKTEKGWTTHKPLRSPHKKGPQVQKSPEEQEMDDFGFNDWQKELARRAKSPDPMWRIKVAKDPNIHPVTLDELTQDDNWLVRAKVAENPNVTQHALEALSEDANWIVQNHVAKNTETPDEILDKMSKSEDRRVRIGVAGNLNAPMKTLKKLANDDDDEIRATAKKNLNLHKASSKALKKQANAGNEDAKAVLENRKKRRHDFCENEIGDEETYSQMKNYKKAIGEKKGWGRNPEQVKQDFIRNMDPSKYGSYEAFQDAKKRIQEMPTKKFDQLLGVIYNKAEEEDEEEIIEEAK